MLLGIPAAVGLGVGYGCFAEPRWLQLRRVRVSLRRQLRSRLRILHLSDFHWSSFVSLSFIAEAIRLGLEQQPAIVCLTGDFVTAGDEHEFEPYVGVLSRLAQAAPTYAVLGNHDGGAWSEARNGYADTARIRRLLERAGITPLHNRCVPAPSDVALVGLADLWSGDLDASSAFAGLDARDFAATVLLAHNPDSKDFVERPWDLMLAGHTHGGQVVLPLPGAPFVPVRDRRFVADLNRWGDRQVYTTRGVGNLYGLRVDCRPEVSVIELDGSGV